jgi:YjbE family integral membrane protein
MLEWLQLDYVALINVIIIDIVLAGDNAIVVGLAASRVKPELRQKVIFWGILGAVLLRISFAAITTQLMSIVGIMLAGGLLLLWVCWKMYREIAYPGEDTAGAKGIAGARQPAARPMSFRAAVTQIIIADVSMSLDNVLAVAGAAKGSTAVLVIGLAVAVVLMAAASHYIARMLARYPWVTWLGLFVILYVALDMIWDGGRDVACQAWSRFWCESHLGDVIRRLLP